MRTLLLFSLAALAMSATAIAQETADPWAPCTVLLHGTWDILPGHADEELFKPNVAASVARWGKVPVPGLWPQATELPDPVEPKKWAETECVWYRHRFHVPNEAKWRRTVLRLAAVRWGSRVWLNGKEVGAHLGAFRVTDFDVTDFLRPGEPNEIVMRLMGWPAIPHSQKDKQYLIAAGSAPHSWGLKTGGVVEFIALHHYDNAFIRSARIQADPDSGEVKARVRFRNYGQRYGQISARLEVLDAGQVIASAEKDFGRLVSLLTKTDDQFVELAAPVKSPRLWSPQQPKLYEARVTLLHDGKVADVFRDGFGFRKFEIGDRAFYLNGERIFLRGTNFYGEWAWNDKRWSTAEGIRRYLKDVPALFHANCVRGHSIPFTQRWLDAADECGMLILQEFPLTVNYDTFEFTADEFAAFARNVESEYRTMIELYWNHPSIIMWVPTNESPRWEGWENGPLYRLFKEADPTRPVLRAGRVSPDVYDTHCYDGWWSGAHGDFDQLMSEAAADARAKGMVFANTEYVENCHKLRAYHHLGPALDNLPPDELARTLDRLRAEVVAEQSECLRRLDAQLLSITPASACVTGMTRNPWPRGRRSTPSATPSHRSPSASTSLTAISTQAAPSRRRCT